VSCSILSPWNGWPVSGLSTDGFLADGFLADGFLADSFLADSFSTDGFLADSFSTDGFLADRSFHLKFNETVQLDRILHRQLLDKRIEKAIHDHDACFSLIHPATHEVEQLFLADA